MQDITPIIDKNIKIIESYGGGSFTISGEKTDENIFIFHDNFSPLKSETLADINVQNLSGLEKIEILLVGYGEKSDFLSKEVEMEIKSKSVSIDYMNTGAAARTYNVLVSEERKVAAILIAV